MSSVEVAGSKDEVIRLPLTAGEPETVVFFSTSLEALEKVDRYSPAPLVGDAKGLSGRLCSKLQLIRKKNENINWTKNRNSTQIQAKVWRFMLF